MAYKITIVDKTEAPDSAKARGHVRVKYPSEVLETLARWYLDRPKMRQRGLSSSHGMQQVAMFVALGSDQSLLVNLTKLGEWKSSEERKLYLDFIDADVTIEEV